MGSFQLLLHPPGHEGKGNELGVSVLECCARLRTMVLEDEDIRKSFVALQLSCASLVSLQHALDGRFGKRRQRRPVVGSLDDDLMSA